MAILQPIPNLSIVYNVLRNILKRRFDDFKKLTRLVHSSIGWIWKIRKKDHHEMKQSQMKSQAVEQALVFPIQVKRMTEQETKEYHLKKLYDLSLKSVKEVPQLEEPTKEQKKYVINRMKAPDCTWERWYVGQYFTEEHKKSMGLTDEDIKGEGIK